MNLRTLSVVIVLIFLASACNRVSTAIPTETPAVTSPLPTATPSPLPKSTSAPEPTSTSTNIPTHPPTLTDTPLPTLTPTSTSFPPIIHAEWTSFTNANYIRALLVDQNGDLWSGGSGGVVHWNMKTGTYVKYMTEHGLVDNNVAVMVQAADGSLWFGTQNGVSRFQNGIWTTFTSEDGLPGDNVTDIAAPADGSVWLSVEGNLAHFDGTSWVTEYTIKATSMTVAPDGSLWVGSGGMVSRYDGKSWDSLNFPVLPSENQFMSDFYVNALAVAADGKIWVGTDIALHYYDGEKWSAYNPWRNYEDIGITALALTPDGALWIGLGNVGPVVREFAKPEYPMPGLYRYDGYNWDLFTTENGLVKNEIRAIALDSDGNAYFGSYDQGISRFDGESWETYQTDDQIPTNLPETLAIDQKGTIWVGNSNGLSCFDGESWTDYQQLGELESNSVDLLYLEPDGTVWIGNLTGVARFDGDNWTTYHTRKYPFLSWIEGITSFPDGRLFFGGWNGAAIFDGEMWQEIPLPTLSYKIYIYDVQAISNNTVWIATGEGLYQYDGVEIRPKYFTTDTTWKSFDNLVFDHDNALWASVAREGIMRLDQDAWTTYSQHNGLPDDGPWKIAVAPDGSIWAGSLSGLFYLDGQHWVRYTELDSIRALAFDSDGTLWVAAVGLYRFHVTAKGR